MTYNANKAADLDRWILRGPPDDDSGDLAYCERCSELTPREALDISGNCETCSEDLKCQK